MENEPQRIKLQAKTRRKNLGFSVVIGQQRLRVCKSFFIEKLDLGDPKYLWVNFQCRDVLLIWIIIGQGPTALTVGAGGGCLDIFL